MNKNCKKKQLVISGVCGFGDKAIIEISFLHHGFKYGKNNSSYNISEIF